MKVLFVTPQIPNPYGGGGVRMYFQIKYLSLKGVKIDLITYNPDINTDIDKYVDKIYFANSNSNYLYRFFSAYPLSQDFSLKMKEILSKNYYDIIHVHKFQMAGYLRNEKRKRILIDLWACGLDGVFKEFLYEKNIFKKIRILWRIPKYFINDITNYSRFDNYFVVSNSAKQYIDHKYPNKNVWVVQNGVEAIFEKNKYDKNNKNNFNLVFLGDMSFQPNVDAVVYFYKKIYVRIKSKIKNVKFLIVGKNPHKKISEMAYFDKTVEVTGMVENVNDYLLKSDVFVAPIRGGSGVRTKIIQAMSCSLPVITCFDALEGIEAKDGESVLVYKSEDDFVEKTFSLYRNKELRFRIGENARNLIKEKYLWKDISDKMLRYYDQILNSNNNKRQ